MFRRTVAFICLGNSCRSIMAEALARHLYGGVLAAASAGINPLGYVAPETLEVLAELGVATAGLHSKGLTELDLPSLDLIVNLTYHSLSHLLPASVGDRVLTRPVADPFGGSLERYRQTRDELRDLLAGELAARLLR